MQKSEMATYVILALVVLNLILTIYYNSRSQEDYRRGVSAPATPAPTQKPVVVATMPPAALAAKQAEAIKLANLNKMNVGSSIVGGR